jgi:very-short-patch-repair endonuclease
VTRIDWKVSEIEELLAANILEAGLPTPKRQYKFHSSRRWLADFCWPESRLIVEVNGMTHVASRGHTSYAGIHRDYEKANGAQDMGYRYYQFDREMIQDGTAIKAICDYLGRCEG